MLNVPYSYEMNGKLVTGNGSLIPISSLSNRFLLPSLTVIIYNLGDKNISFPLGSERLHRREARPY